MRRWIPFVAVVLALWTPCAMAATEETKQTAIDIGLEHLAGSQAVSGAEGYWPYANNGTLASTAAAALAFVEVEIQVDSWITWVFGHGVSSWVLPRRIAGGRRMSSMRAVPGSPPRDTCPMFLRPGSGRPRITRRRRRTPCAATTDRRPLEGGRTRCGSVGFAARALPGHESMNSRRRGRSDASECGCSRC